MFSNKSLKKEIDDKMKQEDAITKLNESLSELERKKENLIQMGAEAEINGDLDSLDVITENILYLTETISTLRQSKLNFDIVTMTSDITLALASAFNAMDSLANGNPAIPNYKKIMQTQTKLARYMKKASYSQKMINSIMKRSNPATKTHRTEAEKESVRKLIDAKRAQILGEVPGDKAETKLSLAEEIAKEKKMM